MYSTSYSKTPSSVSLHSNNVKKKQLFNVHGSEGTFANWEGGKSHIRSCFKSFKSHVMFWWKHKDNNKNYFLRVLVAWISLKKEGSVSFRKPKVCCIEEGWKTIFSFLKWWCTYCWITLYSGGLFVNLN